MLWLADECVDAALVGQLRGAGHDVDYVAELASGVTDTQVVSLAQADGRLLLTEDKGFGELVFRLKLAIPGVVLLRIDPERHHYKWQRLDTAIAAYGDRLV